MAAHPCNRTGPGGLPVGPGCGPAGPVGRAPAAGRSRATSGGPERLMERNVHLVYISLHRWWDLPKVVTPVTRRPAGPAPSVAEKLHGGVDEAEVLRRPEVVTAAERNELGVGQGLEQRVGGAGEILVAEDHQYREVDPGQFGWRKGVVGRRMQAARAAASFPGARAKVAKAWATAGSPSAASPNSMARAAGSGSCCRERGWRRRHPRPAGRTGLDRRRPPAGAAGRRARNRWR